MMRAAFPQAYAFASGPLINGLKSAGLIWCCWIPAPRQTVRRSRCGDLAKWLDATARILDGPARTVVSAPSAVPDRYLAHGPPESPQRRRLAPIVRRHPRVQLIATGHVHRANARDVRWCPDHDLPGAQSRGRSGSGAFAAEPSFKSTAAFHLHNWFPGEDWQRRHPSDPDRRF